MNKKPNGRSGPGDGRRETARTGRTGGNRPARPAKAEDGHTRPSKPPERTVPEGEARTGTGDSWQLEGKNPVWEALKAEQPIDKLIVDAGLDQEAIRSILGAARRQRVRVETAPRARLDALSRTGRHQGLIATLPAARYVSLDELAERAFSSAPDPIFVLMDEMQDPYNVGAVIRSAECAGAAGVILTEHRSPGLTEVVARASAGAVAHLPVCRVTNLSAAIDTLKRRGVWVQGADMDGPPCWGARLTGPLALVVGGEGKGIRRLVAERCDGLVSVPMRGKTGSLNASVAAGVLLFEAVRQRSEEAGK